MAEPLAPHALIDSRFELAERLDDRGYGENWKARDTKLKARFVMLKFLRATGGGELPEALLDHVHLLRAFKHPGVLATVGHGIWQGRPFLVHEFFEGRSLGSGLDHARASGELLPVKLLEGLFARVAAAVAAGHAAPRAVFHGGLSPGCVAIHRMPDEDFQVKVFDFGAQSFADPDPIAPQRSARGLLCLSPEQFAAPDAPLTAAMDIFGLGALLREMLSLPPDPGATMAPTSIHRRRDDCPAALWEAAGVAMHTDPAQRYPTIDAFLEAVQRAWAEPVPTRAPSSAPAAPTPRAQPRALHETHLPTAAPPTAAPLPPAHTAHVDDGPRYQLPALPQVRTVQDYSATISLVDLPASSNPWDLRAPSPLFSTPAQPVLSSMDDLLRAVTARASGAAPAPPARPPGLAGTNLLDEGGAFSRRSRDAAVTTETGTLVQEDVVDLSATTLDPGPPSGDSPLGGTMVIPDPYSASSIPDPYGAPRVPSAFATPTAPAGDPDLGSTMVLPDPNDSQQRPAIAASATATAKLPSLTPPAPMQLPALARPAPPPPAVRPDRGYQTKVAILTIAVLGGLGLALVLVKLIFEAGRP